jgi:hypothetical protein
VAVSTPLATNAKSESGSCSSDASMTARISSPDAPTTAPSSASTWSSGTSTSMLLDGSAGSGWERETGPTMACFGESAML